MLRLPEVIYNKRSVNTHNVDPVVLADWIEASVIFDNERIFISDVVDSLCEENIYAKQDFAREIVEDAWQHLRLRGTWMGVGSPFLIKGNSISPTISSWHEAIVQTFLMALSLAPIYKDWSRQFGTNYIEQGYLFEEVVAASLKAHGWSVHRTGWASGIQNDRFSDVVAGVASCLHEPEINHNIMNLYVEANEQGLDLVCYRHFPDQRGGIPVFLTQCASGANWVSKKHTPDINLWTKLITFSTNPRRGFAMPFALSDSQLLMTCHVVDGMVLDRYRLLSAGQHNSDWIATDLNNQIRDWLEGRIHSLPRDNI